MNTRATVSSVGRADALTPEVLGAPRRFASMPDDLDLDCADADRVRLAVRVVVRCFDGLADEAVLRWPVRNRIAAMLRIAEATFGHQLAWESPCAAATCGQPMALSVPLAPIERLGLGEAQFTWLPDAGHWMSVRLPDGQDQRTLRAIGADPDAERSLATSLVEYVNGARRPAGWQLPRAWIAPLADELARRDPLTDFHIEAVCPWCGTTNEQPVDLEDVVLERLADEQRQALRDVHELARHYHWTEPDIVAIPPARRAKYLARIREEGDA